MPPLLTRLIIAEQGLASQASQSWSKHSELKPKPYGLRTIFRQISAVEKLQLLQLFIKLSIFKTFHWATAVWTFLETSCHGDYRAYLDFKISRQKAEMLSKKKLAKLDHFSELPASSIGAKLLPLAGSFVASSRNLG